MTRSDKRVFTALQRAGELLLERLRHPEDTALLQLHFTVTEAAIQDLGEIFVTPLERRDLLDIHLSLLHASRLACPLSAALLEAGSQTVALLRLLPRPAQTRAACQKNYRLLWKLQAVNKQQELFLRSLLRVCENILRAATA